jgi:hydrogenase maturation protease
MTDVVVGIGNRMRGDDAAGLVALDRLEGRVGATVRLVACSGDVSQLIDAWRSADRAVVIDAVVSGCEPGTLHIVDGRNGLPSRWRPSSTHLIGLAEAIELAWALEVMPSELTIIGVEAGGTALGEALSPPVDGTVDVIVERVAELTHA